MKQAFVVFLAIFISIAATGVVSADSPPNWGDELFRRSFDAGPPPIDFDEVREVNTVMVVTPLLTPFGKFRVGYQIRIDADQPIFLIEPPITPQIKGFVPPMRWDWVRNPSGEWEFLKGDISSYETVAPSLEDVHRIRVHVEARLARTTTIFKAVEHGVSGLERGRLELHSSTSLGKGSLADPPPSFQTRHYVFYHYEDDGVQQKLRFSFSLPIGDRGKEYEVIIPQGPDQLADAIEAIWEEEQRFFMAFQKAMRERMIREGVSTVQFRVRGDTQETMPLPPPSIVVALVSTSIAGLSCPPAEQDCPQEADAKIKFNVTAGGGDVYISKVVAEATGGVEFTSFLKSNAEMVGESGIFVVRAGETRWFEVNGHLKNVGSSPTLTRMSVSGIRWGVSAQDPGAKTLTVDWETAEIFLHPSGKG